MKFPRVCRKWLRRAFYVAVFCGFFGCAAPGNVTNAPRNGSGSTVPGDQANPQFWPKPALVSDFQPSIACAQCHRATTEQHLQSSHESSWTDPVFFAQYTRDLLPLTAKSADLAAEARWCAACHAPVAFEQHRYTIIRPDLVDPALSGVTCDVCHTISAYQGPTPQNGNYVSATGPEKLGPFQHTDRWHHVYNELQTKSELCGTCHNAVNHHGLEVKSTYSEWKESRFAEQGIQCQDCHMTSFGFLVGGAPVYESGRAASGAVIGAPERSKLFTHRFPGAHSKTEVAGAITLTIELDREVASRGEQVTARILVDNSRTGHKMPSGSADLRQLWLSIEIQVGDRLVRIPAVSRPEAGGYDVAGKGKFDRPILGTDIPAGSRLYRSIYVDAQGQQTLKNFEATAIAFDNRLGASEVREETYRFAIPAGQKSDLVIVRASLNYLAYPSSFTRALGLPAAETTEVASTRREIRLR